MELQPENWAGPRAVTWGLRILDKGEVGLKVPHEGLEFCCVYLYAHEACAPPTDGLCSGSPAGTGGPEARSVYVAAHTTPLSPPARPCAQTGERYVHEDACSKRGARGWPCSPPCCLQPLVHQSTRRPAVLPAARAACAASRPPWRGQARVLEPRAGVLAGQARRRRLSASSQDAAAVAGAPLAPPWRT